MDHWTITTGDGTRLWHADDRDHAEDQHIDAFPDEEPLDICWDGPCPNPDCPQRC